MNNNKKRTCVTDRENILISDFLSFVTFVCKRVKLCSAVQQMAGDHEVEVEEYKTPAFIEHQDSLSIISKP